MRKELVFLLEEPSAKALLEGLLPRLLDPSITFRLIPFEGKQDLEKRMVAKLRGYINPEARFIVMRDQDSAPDCRVVKNRLVAKCQEAGKGAVSMVRVACRALETFYLADLAAVEEALQLRGLSSQQANAKFRAPDYLEAPDHELGKITEHMYQKVEGSRLLGPLLDLTNERSVSFKHLLRAIRRLEQELLALPE
ncbi:DUF4276 family protein [Hymenobacter guriensis]|uniref:DUF4276 family protein n=1 Tax=Hymenobacter guriensis TaxID=2793065 RepID=A0ABS0L7R3_9BACT|nr:DUF4276 family protein [Hymenobacter guriensis]MBG8556101.1 DUF4276 family protein [Hymenobacter guriensis]